MSDRVGVYPGSFDPPTYGHLDLIERAARLFDTLIVAVAWNPEKVGLFTPEERIAMIKTITGHIDNVKVDQFTGLTVNFARQHQAMALVRGLRAVSDFEFEMTMAATNRNMYTDCDTISFMPTEQYMFISSRLVKEIAQLDGDVTQFVPPSVLVQLNKKIKGA